MEVLKLVRYLSSFSVRLHLWGLRGSKNVDKLAAELLDDEAELQVKRRNSRMVVQRNIVTVTGTVSIDLKRYRYILEEKYQKLPDGTTRYRKFKTNSLSEKLKVYGKRAENPETPLQGFLRALQDEVQITLESEDEPLIVFYEVDEDGPRESDSFIDIWTYNILHRAMLHLPTRKGADGRLKYFRRHMVERHEDGREIHFGWRKEKRLDTKD